jgi:cobalt/nickel transport system ATP-binding protein
MSGGRPDSDEPLVDLECGAHTYPDGTVGMHDVEFQVYPEEVVALVGANGAGKSTLMEHLNATLVPEEGELVVEGTPITEENESVARKEVGFVFQDADTQLVAPTVLDDVLFGLQNYGVPDEEAREAALEALSRVDASHLKDRIPHYLSGGEKRLIGLAGVLVLDPSVIVLDEPLAGLDPERSRLIVERIRQVHEEGVSVVLSTHDLDFAARISDRVCVMEDGNVVGRGRPKDVFYDDSLLESANLRPPTAVRVARDAGVDTSTKPVTGSELVDILEGVGDDGSTADALQADSSDGGQG